MAAPKEPGPLTRSEFQSFYQAAHAVTSLSAREKTLLGLAVAMTRNCEPGVDRRLADAGKAGFSDEELDAAVDIIAAVNAGIMESLHQRIKRKRLQTRKEEGTGNLLSGCWSMRSAGHPSEQNQRYFYRRWAELMEAKNWNSLPRRQEDNTGTP